MSQDIKNPTIVDRWTTGKLLAIKFFTEEMDDNSRVCVQGELVNNEYNGQLFRAYTEKNPKNHFYFTTNG